MAEVEQLRDYAIRVTKCLDEILCLAGWTSPEKAARVSRVDEAFALFQEADAMDLYPVKTLAIAIEMGYWAVNDNGCLIKKEIPDGNKSQV